LEAEIITLKKDLQKKDMQQNNTKILDNIINIQRHRHRKVQAPKRKKKK
jgi:hypothetical protein